MVSPTNSQMGSLRAKFSHLKASGNQKKIKQDRNLQSPRQLPIRSQNIDMSSFLNKRDDENGSSNPISPNSLSPASTSLSPRSCSKIQNKTPLECSFCKTNGEKEAIYTSHCLKDSLGKLTCPILREFKCPKCGEYGDYAHTNKYCPITQRKKKENKIKKLAFIAN